MPMWARLNELALGLGEGGGEAGGGGGGGGAGGWPEGGGGGGGGGGDREDGPRPGAWAARLAGGRFDLRLGRPAVWAADSRGALWRLKVADRGALAPHPPAAWLPARAAGRPLPAAAAAAGVGGAAAGGGGRVRAVCPFPRSDAVALGTEERAVQILWLNEPLHSSESQRSRAQSSGDTVTGAEEESDSSGCNNNNNSAFLEIKGHHSGAICDIHLNDEESLLLTADTSGDVMIWSIDY